MPLRILIAAALSATAMLVWGALYWGQSTMNMTAKVMRPLPPDYELDVLAPLRAADAPDGMYVYPGPLPDRADKAAIDAWEKKLEAGPILHLTYKKAGTPPVDGTTFARGFAHSFVLALVAGALLAAVGRGASGFARRFGILALVALLAALWTPVGDMIWRFDSSKYTFANVLYTLVAGLLMAAITAAIVKPPAASPTRPAKV
jgi:hypothetical protein